MRVAVRWMMVLLLLAAANAQAQVPGWNVSTYADDGDIVETRIFASDDSSRLVSSVHYIYARGGGLAAAVKYDYREDGVVETHSTAYYKKGMIVSRAIYTVDEVLLYEESFRYDRHQRLIRRKSTDYDGADVSRTLEKRSYKDNTCHAKVYHDGRLVYDNQFEVKEQK